ncbi:hypothetical protein [Hymenobacter sp. APR13]|uniref:hypothetical protein n=1 Tax=Hymenobacter sp. APR13 TaxID=1356852 RepID=UPI000B2F4605|nr:hypothetical protein [Hymenobacter sp. APR13]
MTRCYVSAVAGLWLTCSAPVFAQTLAATTPAASSSSAAAAVAHSGLSTARYDRSDTLRAVQHLFVQRSRATRGWLQTGAGLMTTAAVEKTALALSAAKKTDKQSYQAQQQEANGDLLLGGLMAGYGLFRLSRFGPQQYQRVTEAYAQGQPLPSYLARRLKTKYFRLLPVDR